MLDNARHWYANECTTRARNQTTIINWFGKYMKLRSGKLVGRGIDNARLPPPSDDGDESEEYEFEWDYVPSTPVMANIWNTASAVSSTLNVRSSVVRNSEDT